MVHHACTTTVGTPQLCLSCLYCRPLIATLVYQGTDVSRATRATIETLTATEVLAVNQDKVTVQARCVGRCLGGARPANPLVWAGPLSKNCTVVTVINTGSSPLAHTLSWTDIGLSTSSKMKVRDLWAKEDKGTATGSYALTVETPHDNAMLKLCPA